MKGRFFYILCFALLGFSCESELDLIEAGSSKAIVYGLLDINDTTHYIRINKSFIGEGNAYDYARIADSSQIFNLQPVLEQIYNDQVIRTYTLSDTILPGKDSGLFYNDQHQVYYFNEAKLDANSSYRLVFVYNGKEVSATTDVVGNISYIIPSANQPSISLGKGVNAGVPEYTSLNLKIRQGKNAVLYESNLIFNYKEIYNNGDTAMKSISFGMSAPVIAEGDATASYPGAMILDKIAGLIPDNPDVRMREIGTMTIEILGGGQELQNYLSINQPLSGIVQEKPEYTNVNNGIGLFSSRNIQQITKALDLNTQKVMVVSPLTISKKFCSTHALVLNDPTYYCNR